MAGTCRVRINLRRKSRILLVAHENGARGTTTSTPSSPCSKEVLIGREFQRIRHDARFICEHAVLGDDGIGFDAGRDEAGHHFLCSAGDWFATSACISAGMCCSAIVSRGAVTDDPKAGRTLSDLKSPAMRTR